MNISAPGLSPELTFLVEYLDLPEATGMPDATWESFQLRHLNNRNLLATTLKSRQVGWSWLAAAEAVARSCLYPRSPNIFVSINLEEAGEKIRYAKAVIEALDREVRPKLITDNKLELETTNGSRLLSHPCRPVRGKAKAWVYLDEFAHYNKDREIYQSAVPVITKGGGIRIGSSPLGASGLFWEIFSENMQKFPGYIRDSIPWWQVRALCKNVKLATMVAPLMTTLERVTRFATDRMLMIFENMLLDDFQQEYECEWVDESVAWIDWELIKRNQGLSQDQKLWYRMAKNPEEASKVIDEMAEAILHGDVEYSLVGGMDIGRHKDLSEITLLGESTTNELPFRCGISLDKQEFDAQTAVVNEIMTKLPVRSFHIDQNGLGMQLAEKAEQNWGAKVFPFTFTKETKELLAVEIKLRFQRSQIPIPADRDLMYQIHSIKKKITAAKNAVFDCDASEKHHADKFWSLALAAWAGSTYAESTQLSGGTENVGTFLSNFRG